MDCIDLYLTHRDNLYVPVEEIMDTFKEFFRKGWIKAYGMSNWRLDRFAEAYEYCERMGYQGPSVYSPFFSLVKLEKPWYYRIPAFEEKWLPWFEEHQDVTIAAWSAQGRGFFGNDPQFQPENADPATRMAVLTEEIFARKKQVLILAEKKETRPSQISLLYVLNQKVNMAAIIGPRSKQEMDNVIRVTSERFTQEEIDYLTLERDTLLDQRCLRAFRTNPFKNIGEATQGLLRRCFYGNRCGFSEQDSPGPCAAGTCWSAAFPLGS